MKSLNRGFDIDKFIDQLPAGLERCILRVLRYRMGRERAISRQDLVVEVNRMGFHVDDRQLRAQINLLRKDPHLAAVTGWQPIGRSTKSGEPSP